MKASQYNQSMIRLIMLSIIIVVFGYAGLPSFGVDVPYRSDYVWRGAVFNDEAVLWPDLWANWQGFTFCLWGSFDLTDVKNEKMTFTDIAFFLDYTRPLGPVSATLGFAQYTYPGYNGAFPSTGEAYLKLSASAKIVQVSLAANVDVEEVDGFYISPGLSRSQTFGPITATASASCGLGDKNHNLYYYGHEVMGLADLTATLKLSYPLPGPLGKYLSLSGDVNYSRIIDADLAPDDNGKFYWGIGLNGYCAP